MAWVAQTDCRPTSSSQVAQLQWAPHAAFCIDIPLKLFSAVTCLLCGPDEISLWELSSSTHSLFLCFLSFLWRVVPGAPQKTPGFHFELEAALWQMESVLFFFFKSFLPPPDSYFCCHPPVPYVFQPKTPGRKPCRTQSSPGEKQRQAGGGSALPPSSSGTLSQRSQGFCKAEKVLPRASLRKMWRHT